MWLEIWLLVPKVFLLVFTIFIFLQNKGQNKTQVNLIKITYWNKIVVSHTSMIIIVYINILQFDVCSYFYIPVYWLPTYWEIYEMQYFYVTYRFGDTIWSTLFQLRIQWFSNAAGYATWHVSNSRLLLWCALIALVSSALMLGDPIAMKMRIVETVLHLWGAVSSRSIATQRRCFIVAWSWSFDPETVGS